MSQKYTVKSGDTLSAIAKQYGVGTGSISGYKSGNPNLIYPNEVLSINGSNNNTIQASNIAPAPNVPLPTDQAKTNSGVNSLFSGDSVNANVNNYRKELEKMISTRTSEIDNKIKGLKEQQNSTLDNIQALTTPFRQTLEDTERERLHINKNFEANQTLIDELDTLLTQGNDLIKQQQQVTGLSAIRNPRVQQTMNDISARAGVIEAVINARNGQIGVAENMIDRSINAIASDRKDELTYYETVLNLNNQELISLTNDAKKLADFQVNMIKEDLDRAQKTSDYIKTLLVDPATAGLMGEAGVTLNDSVDQINAKLTKAQTGRDIREFSNKIALTGGVAVADPSTVPANQLITYTDTNGGKHYYKMAVKTGDASGGGGSILPATDPSVVAWVNAIKSGTTTIANVPADLKTSVAAAMGSTNNSGLTFDQYLAAAQETTKSSFTPALVEQLRTQYNSTVGQTTTNANAHSVEDWVNAIKLDYATVAQVPEEMKNQVVSGLTK